MASVSDRGSNPLRSIPVSSGTEREGRAVPRGYGAFLFLFICLHKIGGVFVDFMIKYIKVCMGVTIQND